MDDLSEIQVLQSRARAGYMRFYSGDCKNVFAAARATQHCRS